MPELAVILVVALIVLGPKRLPEVARALGKGLAEFRRVTGEVNKELESARSMIEQEARDHEALRRKTERARAATANTPAVEQSAPGADASAATAEEAAPGSPAAPQGPEGAVAAGSAPADAPAAAAPAAKA